MSRKARPDVAPDEEAKRSQSAPNEGDDDEGLTQRPQRLQDQRHPAKSRVADSQEYLGVRRRFKATLQHKARHTQAHL